MQSIGKGNIQFVRCAVFLMSIHTLYDSIRSLLDFCGIRYSGFIIFIYSSCLLYALKILAENRVRISDIVRAGMWYLLYGMAYVICLNSSQRVYFVSAEVRVIFLYYLPISMLVITRVCDWTVLFQDQVCIWFADVLILVSFLSKLAGVNKTNYMSFSYNLLPLCCITFISAYMYKRKLQWVIVAMGFLVCVVYGARGSLLWFLLFCVFTYIIRTVSLSKEKKELLRWMIKGILLISVVLIAVNVFLPILLNSDFAKTSYILKRIQQGDLGNLAGRDRISNACKEALSQMSIFAVNGLFYDRTILPGNTYAHNVIYEVLLSFGWILGTAFLVSRAVPVIRAFMRTDFNGKIVWLFFVCSFLLRYFISGSIFDEGNFYIFVAGMVSLNRGKEVSTVIAR